MRFLSFLAFFVSTAGAQIPARVVVRFATPTPVSDTSDHADLIPGQRAQFIATAYDVNGDTIRGVRTWSVNPPALATVTPTGLVTVLPGTQGFGWIESVVGGVRGRAALCVMPSRMTLQVPFRVVRKLPVPRANLYTNASTSTATAARVELQALPVNGVSGDRNTGFGRCVHWRLTSLQTTSVAKAGRDGWVTLRDSSTAFTAAASVGVKP